MIMGMLSKVSSDTDNLAKNIKALEAVKKSYDESHKQFLNGRSIEVAQAEAQKKIDSADAEAAKIIKSAEAKMQVAETKLETAEKARVAAQAIEQTAKAKIADNEKLKADLESQIKDLEVLKKRAVDESGEAQKAKRKYETRLSELKAAVENAWRP
jgi:chromosome segregation ATPase